MTLGRLRVDAVRNIKSADLELGPFFNYFVGGNGSGKSSLLESIYFLSTGRSLQASSSGPLINYDAKTCTVYGEILLDKGGSRAAVGVSRERGHKRTIHINGETNHSASQLAQLLPTLCLGPRNIELVVGSPGLRRRFLNWGVFHVEPAFNSVWLDAQLALRQRNMLLKKKQVLGSELESWTNQFAKSAVLVTEYLGQYFEKFKLTFEALSEKLLPFNDIALDFYPGWLVDDDDSLENLLLRDKDKEIQKGYSLWGHHRADIRIRRKGMNVNALMSRGELKLIAWTMLISQGVLFNEKGYRNALFLVDDLNAELDRENSKKVCEVLRGTGSQVCLTGLEPGIVNDTADQDSRLFHVEQGEFMQKEIVS